MLHYLRLEAAWARRVWIDQICINQGDIPERNDQILLMTEIYSRAQQVIAWIGECSPAEKRCLDLVARFRLADTFYDMARRLSHPWKSEVSIDISARIERLYLDTPEIKLWLDDTTLQEAMEGVVRRQYFRHKWIVQEVTVARCVTVKCGECSLDMEHLFNWVACVRYILRRTTPIKYMTYYFITLLDSYRRQYLQHGTMDWNGFQEAFMWTKYHATADLKDQVYALRGICKTLRENTPLLDYSKSDVDIFVETAKASNFTDKGRLTILNAQRSPRHGVDLPTWCPDYGATEACFDKHFPSRKLLAKSIRPNSMPVFDGDCLIVRGIIIDSIASLSEGTALRPGADQPRYYKAWRAWLSFIEPATSSEEGKEPIHLAFWSTLFCDTEDWLDPRSAPETRDAASLLKYVEAIHSRLVKFDSGDALLDKDWDKRVVQIHCVGCNEKYYFYDYLYD
ncbi:Heterokaryon incompatibility protein 6, OR allele [Cytospora mali]|uniref:Heterokaryon incompatibility protein 6, OR allele n=1 Tax=Cytospora mali TaxID=578113 RepID=A0A194V7L5_CYTMA|nr:Heterokaryon incompatibility protein 6, OR allele [Valsa mali var. pyri (nom. inval.)]